GNEEGSEFLNQRKRSVGGLERAHPGGRVQFVLHVRIGVASSAHERGSANHVAAREPRQDFFAAEAVLRGKHSATVELSRHGREGLLRLEGFCGHDAEFTVRESGGIWGGVNARVKIVG